jgi:hypothetical protein
MPGLFIKMVIALIHIILDDFNLQDLGSKRGTYVKLE